MSNESFAVKSADKRHKFGIRRGEKVVLTLFLLLESHNNFSHDSICVSNACPSCHAHLSRAYPALCPHCRSHLPSVPSSSLCESSSLLLQSRQKLNFGSPKNSTGPRSAFTSPNVKIGSPLTSTPVAGVPAQMKASYLGGFPIHSTHINLGKIIIILSSIFFILMITFTSVIAFSKPRVVFLRIKIFNIFRNIKV